MSNFEVFVGIGSNLGNRAANIKKAIDDIKETQGIIFKKASKIIETEPQGGPPQGKFLNCTV